MKLPKLLTRIIAQQAPPKPKVAADTGFDSTILEGFTNTLWGSAWADAADEEGEGPGAGSQILDEMPEPDADAEAKAKQTLAELSKLNGGKTPTELLFEAAIADGTENDPEALDAYADKHAEHFGSDLALQSLGHGVSWFDDHAKFDLKVPHIEFNVFKDEDGTYKSSYPHSTHDSFGKPHQAADKTKCVDCDKTGTRSEMKKNPEGAGYLCKSCYQKRLTEDATKARENRKSSQAPVVKTKTPSKQAGFDNPEAVAHELSLYLYKTSALYRQFLSIIANLIRKINRGVYDPALAPKLWAYWVEEGAKSYAKEFGSGAKGEWSSMFPKDVRDKVAVSIAKDEYEKIMAGEYSGMKDMPELKIKPKEASVKTKKATVLVSEDAFGKALQECDRIISATAQATSPEGQRAGQYAKDAKEKLVAIKNDARFPDLLDDAEYPRNAQFVKETILNLSRLTRGMQNLMEGGPQPGEVQVAASKKPKLLARSASQKQTKPRKVAGIKLADEDEATPDCPTCGGTGVKLGTMGNRTHYRCRQCGMDFSEKAASVEASSTKKADLADAIEKNRNRQKELKAEYQAYKTKAVKDAEEGDHSVIVMSYSQWLSDKMATDRKKGGKKGSEAKTACDDSALNSLQALTGQASALVDDLTMWAQTLSPEQKAAVERACLRAAQAAEAAQAAYAMLTLPSDAATMELQIEADPADADVALDQDAMAEEESHYSPEVEVTDDEPVLVETEPAPATTLSSQQKPKKAADAPLVECPSCGGDGTEHHDGYTDEDAQAGIQPRNCAFCGGTGEVTEEKANTITPDKSIYADGFRGPHHKKGAKEDEPTPKEEAEAEDLNPIAGADLDAAMDFIDGIADEIADQTVQNLMTRLIESGFDQPIAQKAVDILLGPSALQALGSPVSEFTEGE